MESVGMIHLSCDCGAQLFYLGNDSDGRPPYRLMERFRDHLGPGRYGIFSSANGPFGECPHCGILFELPDPSIVNWLPFMDEYALPGVSSMLRAFSGNTNGNHSGIYGEVH
jgi:hypothetical protein